MDSRVLVAGLLLGLTSCASTDQAQDPSPPGEQDRPHAGLRQDGLADLVLRRDVADVSSSDLIDALPPDDFLLRPESEHCSVADRPDGSLTAVMDSNQAVHAFVVRRAGTATSEGIDIGSDVDDVLAAYGDDVSSESDDTVVVVNDLDDPGPEWTELTWLFAFELDDAGRVTVMRGGRFPWLFGCAMTEDYLRQ